jgi:hypothetical protein
VLQNVANALVLGMCVKDCRKVRIEEQLVLHAQALLPPAHPVKGVG